jgi:cell fate (sporulation/competence/biofilm development) regulator YlbF (YheA/YmcA/DUF963 family)
VEAAQALVRAIRSSAEYRDWERLAKRVQADARTEQRLLALRRQAIEIQAAQLQGAQVPSEKVTALQKATAALEADVLLGPYLKAERDLTQLLARVHEAVAQTLQLQVPGSG